MATSRKVESVAAFRLEAGKQPGANTGWGGSASAQTLGAGNAIAYTDFNPGGKVSTFQDDEIDGLGFQDLPVQTGKTAEGSMGGYLRYQGLDALLYWMFGWERPGTSPVDLTGGYYHHLFELDRLDRHCAAYRAAPAEQTAGDYNAADRKNRMATLAIKRGPNDHRYKNAMCKRFGITSRAGSVAQWSADFDAYAEERGDYSSANWTFGTGASGSSLLIPHHHFTVSIGPAGALVAVGVVDFELSVDIPLNHQQDTTTGLYLAEPKGEGKYGVSLKMTLSRHSTDTYLAYRDSYTALCAKIVAASGSYAFGLLFPEIRIPAASLTADSVPNQTLEFVCERKTNAATPFGTELAGQTIIQESPVLCQVKNQNDTNEMRRE